MSGQHRIVITEGPSVVEAASTKRVSWAIYDPTDTLIDPGAVTISFAPLFGTAAATAPVKDAVGMYHADVTPALGQNGRWRYVIATTNPAISDSGIFTVIGAAA